MIYGPQEGAAKERGIAQVHPIHKQRVADLGLTWDDMFNPVHNLTVAEAIYAEQGQGGWSCA